MVVFNKMGIIKIPFFLLFVAHVNSECESTRDTTLKTRVTSIFYLNVIKCNDIVVDEQNTLTNYLKNIHALNRFSILVVNNSRIPNLYNNVIKENSMFQSIYMEGNSISTIQPEAFSNVPKLVELNIGYNNLMKIQKGTFDHLTALKVLNMTNNKLTSVENLENIENLEELDLSNNLLTSVRELAKLTSLKVLHLSNNTGISHSQLAIFASFPNLTDVGISNYSLETIPNVLSNLTLSKLDVSHNKLSEMKCVNINGSINLSNNKLNEICTFAFTVTEINLASNNLTVIPPHAFKQLTKLQSLNLSDCNIDEIAFDTFTDLVSLRHLFLRSNNIEDIETGTFYHLENLEILDLAFNDIDSMHHGIFTGLNKLTTLYLNHNNLMYLNADVFYPLTNVREIYLDNNNFLDYVSSEKFTNHLVNLRRISISFTDINCEQLSFFLSQFNKKNVSVVKGPDRLSSNIHGMSCNPDGKINDESYFDEIILHNLTKIYGILITVTVLFFILIIINVVKLYRKFVKKGSVRNRDLYPCSLKLLSENE